MTEINNYTLSEFLKQDAETIETYCDILRHVEPVDTKQPIIKMSLWDVDTIKRNLANGNERGCIELVQGITEAEVMKIKIVEYFGLIKSIGQQIEKIVKAEDHLQSEHTDAKFEMVRGGERLQKFGLYNTLDRLSNSNPREYGYWKKQPYDECFTILLRMKEVSDIQHEMTKIKAPN